MPICTLKALLVTICVSDPLLWLSKQTKRVVAQRQDFVLKKPLEDNLICLTQTAGALYYLQLNFKMHFCRTVDFVRYVHHKHTRDFS